MVNIKASKVHRAVKFKKVEKSSFNVSLVLALLFLGLLGIWGIFQLGLFKIEDVVIKPNTLSCASTDRLNSEIKVLGENYFSIDEESLKKNLKAKFLCINNISLERVFPNKLTVNISERKAAAILKVKSFTALPKLDLTEATVSSETAILKDEIVEASSSTDFIVDRDGVVFQNLNEGFNLPSINLLSNDIKLGYSFNSGDINMLLQVLEKLPQIPYEAKSVKLSEWSLEIDGAPKLFFSLKKDVSSQLASLQLILQKAKINSEDPTVKSGSNPIESIDLRFDKPVLKYAPKK